MEKSRKQNWTKEEECTLISEIESAGELLRGSGNSADLNKKKKELWKTIAGKVNAVHGNNRCVEDNNLKLAAKSTVDASFRESRRTGGGSNFSGIVEDDDKLILAADKSITNTDRIREMFETTPAFSGISGAVDNFVSPPPASSEQIPQIGYVDETLILDAPEVPNIVNRNEKKSRKQRRDPADDQRPTEFQQQSEMKAADLLPLQQEVVFQQMAVFSAQLQLIEEQRVYYRLKRQKLLEKS